MTQKRRELETHMVFFNDLRRQIKAGDQLHYFYGQRNNQFLFMNYGFTMPDNKYDSMQFYVNRTLADVKGLDLPKYFTEVQDYSNNSEFQPKLIYDESHPIPNRLLIKHTDLGLHEGLWTETIRLKKGKLNSTLILYLRVLY